VEKKEGHGISTLRPTEAKNSQTAGRDLFDAETIKET
jgi:hypothetical protein